MINDVFKKYLLFQPPQYRKRLKKQIEFLEIGMWDGGVKVKKIKGTRDNRTVFEARLDRGNRIIFTLGFDESTREFSQDKNVLIYIWGIVSHDDISNKSKAIIPANAPFLKFSSLGENNVQELILDDLDDSHYTQEYITKKISDDAGSQKWHRLNDADWERIELFTKDDFDLYLYLTPTQIDVLKMPPPVLLSGTAGSGKTTIGVYYLLKKSIGSYRKLFITYNKFLKVAAERLYTGLLNSDKSAGGFVHPDFYTYKEFCLHTVNRFSSKFLPENEINYERFTSLMQQNRSASKYDTPLIWEEIRSIIKGGLPQLNAGLFTEAIKKLRNIKIDAGFINILHRQFTIFSNLESAPRIEHLINKYLHVNFRDFLKNFTFIINNEPERVIPLLENILELLAKQKEITQKKYLSFLEYEMMGKKKAPNFNLDRKEIYQIFEWYQNKLETGGLWDELDLTKEAINIFTDKDVSDARYDLVICDEVQDLTDIQHDLLFYAVKSPLNLILTGDTKQIINPSGFRWEELKQHFYERDLKIPEINFLSLNFRSSGSIVELSNCLLDIKTELLGLSSDQLPEDWKFKNRPPVIVAGISESVIINNLRATGAGKTILVRTEEEKKLLKALLETELIFTISEAKGLEFDTVFLWKFCSEKQTADIWDTIFSKNYSSVHSARIKHEINLLYVAITRAQKDLLIYDGHRASVIWDNPRIGEKVVISNDMEFIDNIWNVLSSPEEWLEQGNYYFEREYYMAAIECYKNAGAKDPLLKAEAFYFEKKGDFIEAAKRFELLGEWEKAARYFEKCEAFSEALALWILLEQTDKANICRVQVYEKARDYSALADLYVTMKEPLKAAENYAKNKSYLQAADLFHRLKIIESAAINYELGGHLDKAAPLYAKIKKYEKAADLYEKISDFAKAESLLKKLKNTAKLLNLYQKSNNIPMLLKYYAKAKDSAGAIKLLKKNYSPEETLKYANQFFKKGQHFEAYAAYQVAGDDNGIALTSLRLKKYSEAGNHFEKIGKLSLAGNAYAKGKDYKKAFVCYTQSTDNREEDFENAKKVAYKMGEKAVHEVGQSFFSKGKYELALQCSLAANNYFNAGMCYVQMLEYDNAVEAWKRSVFYSGLESIADYCISVNKPELCARVLFGTGPEILANTEVPQIARKESKLISLMDIYFKNAASEEEMFQWAESLNLMDRTNNYIPVIYEYYKKSRFYNDLYKYIKMVKILHESAFISIREELWKLISTPQGKGDEFTAIAFDMLDMKDNLQHLLSNLEVNVKNYLLFTGSSQKEKAYDYLMKIEDYYTIKRVLYENKDFLIFAEYCEKLNNKSEAADYYLRAKEYRKAISIFVELGYWLRAGDTSFFIGDYENALAYYNRYGKNELKIADTLFKLGEYEKAKEIYIKKNKRKKVEEIRQLQWVSKNVTFPEEQSLFE